jgi:hypothetical protein
MFGAPLVSPDSGPIPGVPMEQPKNLFRFGEQTIWSTQLLQNNSQIASGTFRMFTTPLGQVGQLHGLVLLRRQLGAHLALHALDGVRPADAAALLPR